MNTEKPETPNRPIALAIAAGAGVLAIVLRLVPHPTNFSSVGALSLFGGARVKTWHAYLFPLAAMIVSDLGLWIWSGFRFDYSLAHPSRIFVYGSFMIYVAIGRWLIDKNSLGSIALAGTLGGLQFFVMTNFCEWLLQPMYYDLVAESYRYSRDLNGLLACFTAALPFYQGDTAFSEHPFVMLMDFKFNIFWMILGDVVFTSAYVLVHDWATQPQTVPAPTTAEVPT